ncbi:MAG: hypothetical protein E4H29_04925 [Deltaproteobacteria bacterium]|nr:MAG: hypothetical protein E4H29_04925 [Deltaproteobacteria bacterium]
MPTRIRSILMIALGLMMATVIGCGGGGETSTSEGTPLPARVLSWEAPTSYVDATPMDPVTVLDRFEIHVNERGIFTDKDVPMAELDAVDPQTRALATSFNIANIGSPLTMGPHYYVSLRAVALTGLKSDFSTPVSFSF